MTSPMGKRVLIVEDEVLVALYMEDIIVDMGHLVIGPAITFDDAMEHARSSDFDFAVIDMNSGGYCSLHAAFRINGKKGRLAWPSLIEGDRCKLVICTPRAE